MRKYLFIDRDGTIIREPKDYQIDSLKKISFLPSVNFYTQSINRCRILSNNGQQSRWIGIRKIP